MNATVDDAREFVADTREEALSKAENFFRTSADQLDEWVVPDTVQVSGLGSRLLLIAAPKSAKPAAREDRRPERRDERREERRPERTERAERPPRREAAPERAREERPREERPREERPREDRPRERPERAERSEPRPRPERAPAATRAAPEPVDDAIEDVEDGELGPVGEFIAGILERMKLREVAITESETDDGDIIISLAGKSLTVLADRDPRLGAALSHLAHRAAEMLVDEDAGARVEIRGTRRPQVEERNERPARDSRRGGGGRSERSEPRRDDDRERDVDEVALERMAREGAEIVRRTGEPELLRPMNSRERWVVHNALKDERGVRSESEGEGPRKRVRITPV